MFVRQVEEEKASTNLVAKNNQESLDLLIGQLQSSEDCAVNTCREGGRGAFLFFCSFFALRFAIS